MQTGSKKIQMKDIFTDLGKVMHPLRLNPVFQNLFKILQFTWKHYCSWWAIECMLTRSMSINANTLESEVINTYGCSAVVFHFASCQYACSSFQSPYSFTFRTFCFILSASLLFSAPFGFSRLFLKIIQLSIIPVAQCLFFLEYSRFGGN